MQILIVGEAMLEYRAPSSAVALPYGGDTLNTAIHLSRMGARVQYLTALGTDRMSDSLARAWSSEGIDTRFVLKHPLRQPGIYAIQNDASGERSFLYWREQSAAREMFSLPDIDAALDAIHGCDLLYFSLITLAILPLPARERLLQAATVMRARGGRFAFDGNYRPALWPLSGAAEEWSMRAAALADFGLPTADDETLMTGQACDAATVARRWQGAGTREVAVKTGLSGCLLATSAYQTIVPPPRAVSVLDSSGAGDAFNAGYLKARMDGIEPTEAAVRGHELAGWVIARAGAIPPRDAASPYSG